MSISQGIPVDPELTISALPGSSSIEFRAGLDSADTLPVKESAAAVLVEHLFARTDIAVPGISYAVSYRLAEELVGGDIVDVYHFDNDAVAVSIADISGKGVEAAVHAALIKYGLRAYSSQGLTPERALRAMDRLYLENNSFEKKESFASVFFGIIEQTRRLLMYSSAGHEPVLVISPAGQVEVLRPTAPLIGVFDDQHHLFRGDIVHLESGTMLLATTDGITEARDPSGAFYGMESLVEIAGRHAATEPETLVGAVLNDVEDFCRKKFRDDIAIVAVAFH